MAENVYFISFSGIVLSLCKCFFHCRVVGILISDTSPHWFRDISSSFQEELRLGLSLVSYPRKTLTFRWVPRMLQRHSTNWCSPPNYRKKFILTILFVSLQPSPRNQWIFLVSSFLSFSFSFSFSVRTARKLELLSSGGLIHPEKKVNVSALGDPEVPISFLLPFLLSWLKGFISAFTNHPRSSDRSKSNDWTLETILGREADTLIDWFDEQSHLFVRKWVICVTVIDIILYLIRTILYRFFW